MLANTRTYVAPQTTSGPFAQTEREPGGRPLRLGVCPQAVSTDQGFGVAMASPKRAVDNQLVQGVLDERELVIVELSDEQA
jgi:hypothetical protein